MVLWLLLLALSLGSSVDSSTRYILVYHWPKFYGNLIISLSEALLIAKELNRVLIIPPIAGVIDVVKIAATLDVPVIYGESEWPLSLIGSRLKVYSGNGIATAHEGPFRELHPTDASDVIRLDNQIIQLGNIIPRAHLGNSTSIKYMTFEGTDPRVEIVAPRNRLENVIYHRQNASCSQKVFDLSPPYSDRSFANENAANHYDPCFLETLHNATDHLRVFALNVAWYSVDWRSHVAFYRAFKRLLIDQLPREPQLFLKKRGIKKLTMGIQIRLFGEIAALGRKRMILIIQSVEETCAEWVKSHDEKCSIFVGSNMIENHSCRELLSRIRALPDTVVFTSEDTKNAIHGSYATNGKDIAKETSKFAGNAAPSMYLMWDMKLYTIAEIFVSNFPEWSTISMNIMAMRQEIGKPPVLTPWETQASVEEGVIYAKKIGGIIFPNDYYVNRASIVDFFARVHRKFTKVLDKYPIKPPEWTDERMDSKLCYLVPDGDNTSLPAWATKDVIDMAVYNPLLMVVARSTNIDLLAKLCFGEAWWIRLIYLSRISASLTPEERLKEYAGFIIFTYKRLTRYWTGEPLRSFVIELREGLIGGPLRMNDASYLLTLPFFDLPYDPDPMNDFRLTYRIEDPNYRIKYDDHMKNVLGNLLDWKQGYHIHKGAIDGADAQWWKSWQETDFYEIGSEMEEEEAILEEISRIGSSP